jgi:tRNA pseudouridine55 synthase
VDKFVAPPPPFAKIVRRPVNGLLLLDKPVGLSSTQAMAAAKRLFRAEKAGHTGTLDPFATGLLPIAFGEAAKFSRFLLDADKTYRATLKLGATSSTGDTEGVITMTGKATVSTVAIEQVLSTFIGAQTQQPPMYSALKHDGVALYKLARQGIEVAREARAITVLALTLVAHEGDVLTIDTTVSKGTYIRVLSEDIGRALGTGAYLTALRRTASSGFTIHETHTIERLATLDEAARDALLLPPQALCQDLPQVMLTTEDARIFSNGGWLPASVVSDAEAAENTADNFVAVYAAGTTNQQQFLGVGSISANARGARLVPERVMSER